MKNKFSVNKNWWFTLAKKIRVIFIWIDEKINKHFNVRRRHESNVFVEFSDVFEILNEIFKNHDKKRNARKIYNKFKMKSNQIFSKFYSKFILLINQLRDCIEAIKMKNLKEKITTKLTLITINSDFFYFLKFYKKHLQSIDVKFNHLRSESQFASKITIKTANRVDKTSRTTDALLRMLFKIKFHIDIEKQILKNLFNYFNHNVNCWDCENFHFLIDCLNLVKKTQWVQKKFKIEIVNLKKINDESNMQLVNLKIKISKKIVSEINEFDFEMIRFSKN